MTDSNQVQRERIAQVRAASCPDGRVSARALARVAGITQSKAHFILTHLARQGAARRIGPGVYTVWGCG